VTGRSHHPVPSGPLLLTTSSSSEQKTSQCKSNKSRKDIKGKGIWEELKHVKQNRNEINEMIKNKMVSMSTNPSQSLEGAAEIRESGVRFPVEVRICFVVNMWMSWFEWVTMRWIRIEIKMRTRMMATRLMRMMVKTFWAMLKRWKWRRERQGT
jgi:uncharacterized secreted protein with C-terminal beta-propeller domain